ncbi:Calmodulin-binding transcription activator [Arachis hypogaea]|nr:Calmodulin-binding transcription activator [Arachis hypogaea]
MGQTIVLEYLHAGNVDVLNCYYAHGEDNENFQRRSYWMLDEQLEHIVLVHYRHIKEGYKSGVSHSPAAPVSLVGSSRTSSAPSSVKIESPISVFQTSVSSTANEVEQAGRASVCDDRHSENGPQVLSHARPIDTSIPHNARLLGHEATGFAELMRDPLISWSSSLPSFYPGSGLSSCATIENTSRTTVDMNDGELHVEADPINQHVQNFRDRLMTDVCIQPVTGMLHAVNQVQKEHDLVSLRTQFHHHHPVLATKNVVEQKFQDGGLDNDDPQNVESGELKKLDCFGWWMDKEIG